MYGYMKIYVKNDWVGHVRYELYDDYRYREIRGLSVGGGLSDMHTIYERGYLDKDDISIYNQEEYLASEEIPLDYDGFTGAMIYTRINDESHEEYGFVSQNCNDFTSGALSAAGQTGCVGDYLTPAQKDSLRLSQGSDLIKCRIPKKAEDWIKDLQDKFKETIGNLKNKVKQRICNGTVNVGSYTRDGYPVEGYTRVCGRH